MIATLMTSNGKLRYINSAPVTDSEKQDLRNIYLEGQCLALAVALARKNPGAEIFSTHDDPEGPLNHAWCKIHKGIIDVRGYKDISEYNRIRKFSPYTKSTKVDDFLSLEHPALPIQDYSFAAKVIEENISFFAVF